MPDQDMRRNRGIILIVDDTPANLGVLSDMLSSVGYQVRPAPSGRLALRAAENDPPDLILLDINMPEMNGFEVCRRIKADDRLRDIPVLFISALAETKDKIRAFETGGMDYITKPFQAEEVLARVSTHLQNRRYQMELEEKSRTLQKALDDLKAAQNRLIHSEKMASLGVLTAGIAHEINNPVNYIKTSALALEQDMEDIGRLMNAFDDLIRSCPDDIRQKAKAVKSEIEYDELNRELPRLVSNITLGVERTEEIVSSLRLYARPDDRKKILSSVGELMDTALLLLKNHCKKGVTIRKDYGELPEVAVQPGRLIQVFSNVIGNAVDAVTEDSRNSDPTIEIRIRRETREGAEFAVTEVADNGPGISREIIGKIFDPFFTTKEIGRGVGLGMSISFGIIRDHGGFIDVRSREGKGAEVSIFLPISREAA